MTTRTFLLLACLGISSLSAAETALPPGLRILTAGHSFHVWMPGGLIDIANKAGIQGHQQVGLSSIGGSRTIQHWDAEGEKQKIKPVLMEGKADVLTLSPIYLPDEGIENFVKLGLEHNPNLRITIQEFWLPFDDTAHWATRAKGVTIDRDAKTISQLREAHAPYFQSMDQHVRELNEKYGKGKTAVFVVPVGQAVLELRDLIIQGKAPGIAKQSELVTDPIGHPKEHIKALSAYCHYAVIYGRSPVGLPMPGSIQKLPEAEKLNPLLQQLAWDAVKAHPLSGVK